MLSRATGMSLSSWCMFSPAVRYRWWMSRNTKSAGGTAFVKRKTEPAQIVLEDIGVFSRAAVPVQILDAQDDLAAFGFGGNPGKQGAHEHFISEKILQMIQILIPPALLYAMECGNGKCL